MGTGAGIVGLRGGRCAEYEVIGDGPALLYFTGGPGENAAILRKDARLIADLFTVYLIEPHGSGGSTPPADASAYDAIGHARFYDEVREALEIPRASIMGFSFGASVALAYAGLFPAVATRCVAVAGRAVGADAGPESDAEMERALALHASAPWYKEARAAWDQVDERVLSMEDPAELDRMRLEVLPFYMGDPESPTAEAILADWRRNLRSNLAASQAWVGGLWEALDLRDLLRLIACPTLVLAGDLDLACGPYHARAISAHVPHAAIVTVPKCGHFIPSERPEEFRSSLVAFCESDAAR